MKSNEALTTPPIATPTQGFSKMLQGFLRKFSQFNEFLQDSVRFDQVWDSIGNVAFFNALFHQNDTKVTPK